MAERKKQKSLVIAVDLGGTKILAALVSRDGRIVARERRLTGAEGGPRVVIDRLCGAIDALLEREKIDISQLQGISVSAAGGIDDKKGVVTKSPNLPGWHDIPLRDMVKERYNLTTFLINDASAAALGEHRFGVARDARNFVLLTIGTGIGGGIVIDGKLYHGAVGSAGELGHMTIDVNGPVCKCGNIGCLEVLASGTAMAEEARRRIKQGEPSILADLVGGNIDTISGKEVGDAAEKGDALALDVIRHAATYLGIGMVNLVNIFNPEMIVVGGGVSSLGELLLAPARRLVQERAFPVSARAVKIVLAKLGNEAGILGAAAYAFEH